MISWEYWGIPNYTCNVSFATLVTIMRFSLKGCNKFTKSYGSQIINFKHYRYLFLPWGMLACTFSKNWLRWNDPNRYYFSSMNGNLASNSSYVLRRVQMNYMNYTREAVYQCKIPCSKLLLCNQSAENNWSCINYPRSMRATHPPHSPLPYLSVHWYSCFHSFMKVILVQNLP